MQHAGGYRPRDVALPVEWIVALPSSGPARTISPPTCPRRRSKLRAQVRVWCVIGRKDAACAALMSQHHRGAGFRIGGQKKTSLSARETERVRPCEDGERVRRARM